MRFFDFVALRLRMTLFMLENDTRMRFFDYAQNDTRIRFNNSDRELKLKAMSQQTVDK